MAGGFDIQRDIVYGQGGDSELLLDLYLPRNPVRAVPIILYIHGGGWIELDKNWCPYPMRFLEKEFAVASINYRLSDEAPFPAQLHDCKAAVRWLRDNADTYGLDADHIGAWGDSAGGHLAALLGLTAQRPELEGNGGNPGVSSEVQAVCDWFGPSHLAALVDKPVDSEMIDIKAIVAQLIGGPTRLNPDKLKQASPITYVSSEAAPFLIMHGDIDRIVPVSQSVLLYEALWLAGSEVRLHVVHGSGHLDYNRRPIDVHWHTRQVEQLVDDFFYKHLMCAEMEPK
ncbi:MAG: alpha/beta hydrolase [Anaerolineae bacterium]|nr:alpha/beta hydrolase [Anaerolineae bacterium]